MPTSSFNKHFPGYEILGEIGRGNARVLKARNQITGVLVAIKHFAIHTDEPTLHRFQRESEIMTSVNHPNVVKIEDVQLEAELPYIVMELVEGGDLRSLLTRQTTLDVDTVIRLGLQMAEAFAAIHGKNIIHRDIKPENIMYRMLPSGEYHFLLTDFGIAKLRERSGTLTGAAMMTYEYASPEQFDDPGSVGPETDYYSLGAVLYECLDGKPPFVLENGRVHTLMNQVMHQPPPEIGGVGMPPALRSLISALLIKPQEDRLTDVLRLKLELKKAEMEALSGTYPPPLPVPPATPPVPSPRMTMPAVTPPPLPEPAPAYVPPPIPQPRQEYPERRSIPWVWICVGAFFAIAALWIFIERRKLDAIAEQQRNVVIDTTSAPADAGTYQPAPNTDTATVAEPTVQDPNIDTVWQNSQLPVLPPDGDPGIYKFVEQMPAFSGDLNKYLADEVRYPEEAREGGEEGRTVVQFVVDERGAVANPEVVRSSGSEFLDAEALRVVSEMPAWKPGRTGGQAVKVYYTLPVTFKLDD